MSTMQEQTNVLREKALTMANDGNPVKALRAVSAIAVKSGKVMVEGSLAIWAARKTGASNADIAAAFGKGTSTVTLYRRLGAYLVNGGEPTGDDWTRLSGKSKANFKAVGAVLDKDEFTPAEVTEVLNANFKADGSPLNPVTREGQTNQGEQTSREQALSHVKAIADLVKAGALSTEDFAVVESAITEMRTRAVKQMLDAQKALDAAEKDAAKISA